MRGLLCTRYAVPYEALPGDSPDFSWDDVLDVAALAMRLEARHATMQEPPYHHYVRTRHPLAADAMIGAFERKHADVVARRLTRPHRRPRHNNA